MDPIDATSASGLASAAILASLVGALANKGLLSDSEVKEIYEQALLLIEEGRGASPETAHVFDLARAILEEQLRGEARL